MAGSAQPSEQQVTEAWVYLLGRYLVVRQEAIDVAEPGITYNVLKHNPAVVSGAAAGTAPTFVNPNLDVVYSEAWIAVDESTPAILQIPEIPAGRYYTAQIVDEWAEITHNINERNFPHHPSGRFAICLAGSSPDIPPDSLRVDIPSAKAKLLTRVQLGTDPATAVALQHQFSLESTGRPDVAPPIEIPPFDNAHLPGAWVFAEPQLDAVLAAADACGRAEELHAVIRQIGAYLAENPDWYDDLDRVVHATAIPAFLHFVVSFGNVTNGWSSTANYPNFGDDYWFRATANFGGIWWNSSKEAVYELLHVDADGQPTSGEHSYRMTFEAQRLPASIVGGYWSLTVYGKPGYMLVPNPDNKFTVGSQSLLEANADGSITLTFASKMPDGVPASNWLPIPDGEPFTADLRLYLPTDDVRNGSWAPPPLVKI